MGSGDSLHQSISRGGRLLGMVEWVDLSEREKQYRRKE